MSFKDKGHEKDDVDFSERRRFVRLNSAVDIQYNLLEKEPAERLKTKSRNISAGGICIIASEKLEIDDILVISITVPGETLPVVTKGRVAWIKPFEIGKEGQHFDVGIEFIEISPEDRKKIEQYVFTFKKP
jgi:c-di-GMP-binding flagellar brake protein YcgR